MHYTVSLDVGMCVESVYTQQMHTCIFKSLNKRPSPVSCIT